MSTMDLNTSLDHCDWLFYIFSSHFWAKIEPEEKILSQPQLTPPSLGDVYLIIPDTSLVQKKIKILDTIFIDICTGDEWNFFE